MTKYIETNLDQWTDELTKQIEYNFIEASKDDKKEQSEHYLQQLKDLDNGIYNWEDLRECESLRELENTLTPINIFDFVEEYSTHGNVIIKDLDLLVVEYGNDNYTVMKLDTINDELKDKYYEFDELQYRVFESIQGMGHTFENFNDSSELQELNDCRFLTQEQMYKIANKLNWTDKLLVF